ncbi:MAG: hypothetical protein P8X42_15660 [Calditrichaceae bacterium]
MKVKLKIKIKSKYFTSETKSVVYNSKSKTEYYTLGSFLKSKAA